MANDAIQCAAAANRDVPQGKPKPIQDCSDVVHIAVFFDGTGNNKDADESDHKWSNVARMYFSAQRFALDNKGKFYYTIYISGVGTRYNGKAVDWISSAGVWLQDSSIPGMGFGTGGDRRLDQGDDAVSDRLRDVLIANAKAQGGPIGLYASASTNKSFSEVNAALGKHRLIKVINLSIFGFSRGAALARAFSNRVIKDCKQDGDQLTYHGYPLRLNFMGIFDTVASFGVPSENARLPFEERDLIVSKKIERCVHFVAAHEVRFSFPVDLIRKNGKLAGDWLERTYPGVHSDVGGGYAPHDQMIDNNQARIPMREMMREATAHGVRLYGYDIFKKAFFQQFTERLECRTETEVAYNNYMAVCGPPTGTIEQQMRQHQKVFFSACGTMHRKGIKTPGERGLEKDKYKYLGPKGMAWEVAKYRKAVKLGKWVRFGGATVNSYAQYVKPQEWQLAAWDTTASDGVVDFVSKFIHDSKVDFIGNLVEPFSYFKPRGVEESSISIWQEGGNWIGSKAKAVEQTAESTYDVAKNEAGKAKDATLKAAKDAADAARTKAEVAAAFAKQKAAEAKDAAVRAYDATAQAAKEAAEAAQRKAEEASEFAKHKAKEAENAASRAYEATAKVTKDASVAVGEKTDELERGAQRLYEKGKHWVQHTAHELSDQTDQISKDVARKLHIK